MFSEALKLWFRWEDQLDSHVRLLRPYLPDGTPINTSVEEQHLREQEQHLREREQLRRIEAEARAEEAERLVKEEAERRQALEVEVERLRSQLSKRS